jgi:8-oxo-dGTP diphosphatase
MRNPTTFLTVDAIIFKKINDVNQVLLIERKNNPYKNHWALSGGFVEENEDLLDAVKRELFEETNIVINDLQQLGAFGKPFRDPRGHVVSIVYFGFVAENTIAIAADDAKSVFWFEINDLPKMAFDHSEIINFALTKI